MERESGNGSRVFIGVDPGKSGGVAFLSSKICEAYNTEDEMWVQRMRDFQQNMFSTQEVVACVEKVHAMPKQGVVSVMTFGTWNGIVLGALKLAAIPYILVTPRTWQKVIFDSAKREENRKEQSRLLAHRLFPHLASNVLRYKKDHNKAEALLIAEYMRRTYAG